MVQIEQCRKSAAILLADRWQLWAWNKIFMNLCDKHAPVKKSKREAPHASSWITNDLQDSRWIEDSSFSELPYNLKTTEDPILVHKLQHRFGITSPLLAWLQSYLHDRKQFPVINGKQSSMVLVTHGILQGSVLGLTLFVLFTNDLPLTNATSGTTYMYADDTTLYCAGNTVRWGHLLPESSTARAVLIVRYEHTYARSCYTGALLLAHWHQSALEAPPPSNELSTHAYWASP